MKPFAILFLAASALLAQNPVEGPVTGWVWDSNRSAIRPVLGIPGASVLGEGVDAGVVFSNAVAARGYSIGIAAEGGQAYLVRANSQGRAELMQTIPAGASRIVLSPGGDSAAFLYEDPGKLVVVDGLPSIGSEPREYNLGGVPSALALADGGAFLAATLDNTVLILDRDGNRWNAGQDRAANALAFLDASNDLLIGDESALWLLRNVRNPERSLLAETAVRAVSATVDRAYALAVDGNSKLQLIHLASRTVRELETPVEPALLSRLAGNVFRINDSGTEPMWLVDLSTSEPRTVFVPADPKPAEQ